MTEQQQREQIEKRHQEAAEYREDWGIDCKLGDEAHEDRGQLLTWLRERDEQIASLRRELARFQRADVGERVRYIEAEHRTAPDVHDEIAYSAAMIARGHRGELLDICRQQAAEIERLRADHQALLSDTAPLHALADGLRAAGSRARAWKRCAKKWRRMARAYEDAPTDKHERCEPFEEFEELAIVSIPVLPGNPEHDRMAAERLAEARRGRKTAPIKPASEEEFRPGLPPVALRKVCREWEDCSGDVLSFSADGRTFVFLTVGRRPVPKGERCEFVPMEEGGPQDQFTVYQHRPHGKSWSEVEQEAAKALGAEDATAGSARRPSMRILDELGVEMLHARGVLDAYAAAYDAAKGG